MKTAGQQIAVEDLLQHAGWLRSLAGTLVGASSADDLVQEAYLAAMRSPPDPERPARPWLAKVLRNAARMRFRGDSRRAEREVAIVDSLSKPESPADSAERIELQRMLFELVLALPEPYRATVVGLYFDGLKAVELAKRDGVNPATVRQRHKHALGLLRDMLDQRSEGDRRSWHAALMPIAKPPDASIANPTAGGALALKGIATVIPLKAIAILAVLVGSTATAVWATWSSDRVAGPPTFASQREAAYREASREPKKGAAPNGNSRRSRRQRLLAALRRAHPPTANAKADVAQPERGNFGGGGPEEIEEVFGHYAPYLRQRVGEFSPLLRECYESARTRRPELAGTLVLEFAIIGDEELGSLVEEARILDEESSLLPDEELRDCVTETLYALEIEPPPGGGRLVYKAPFAFTALESDAVAPTPRSAGSRPQPTPASESPHGAAKAQRERSPDEHPETEETLKCDEVLCLVHPEREPACCSQLEKRRRRIR
jgi:RNA polymerase sigma factor (sigma-70 family)